LGVDPGLRPAIEAPARGAGEVASTRRTVRSMVAAENPAEDGLELVALFTKRDFAD
jgi:hypothetical protein